MLISKKFKKIKCKKNYEEKTSIETNGHPSQLSVFGMTFINMLPSCIISMA